MVELIVLSFLFALLCLDKKHIFQFALSQPLITCSIIGLYFDMPIPAMHFGLIVQLLWLSNLPIGAAKTPEGNIGSIIGCILYVQNIDKFTEYGNLLLIVTFLITVFVSYAASRLESFDRRINIKLFDYNCNALNVNEKSGFGSIIVLSLIVQFLINFVTIFWGLFFGGELIFYLSEISSTSYNFLWQYIEITIIGSGLGMLIAIYKEKNIKRIIVLLSFIFLVTFKII